MNRHLYGDMLPINVTVPDYVVVKPGDLMLIARKGNIDLNTALKGTSGGTNYAYPWASASTVATAESGTTRLNYSFCGVALDDSPHGSTDTISCATAGVFEFPLWRTSGITIGALALAHASGFSAASNTTASYQIVVGRAGTSIGWIVAGKSAAKTARVSICTKFGTGAIVSGGAA